MRLYKILQAAWSVNQIGVVGRCRSPVVSLNDDLHTSPPLAALEARFSKYHDGNRVTNIEFFEFNVTTPPPRKHEFGFRRGMINLTGTSFVAELCGMPEVQTFLDTDSF